MARIDNLREYKREVGITAKHRKPLKGRPLTERERQKCSRCHAERHIHERTYGLVPDHNFVEFGERREARGSR